MDLLNLKLRISVFLCFQTFQKFILIQHLIFKKYLNKVNIFKTFQILKFLTLFKVTCMFNRKTLSIVYQYTSQYKSQYTRKSRERAIRDNKENRKKRIRWCL